MLMVQVIAPAVNPGSPIAKNQRSLVHFLGLRTYHLVFHLSQMQETRNNNTNAI